MIHEANVHTTFCLMLLLFHSAKVITMTQSIIMYWCKIITWCNKTWPIPFLVFIFSLDCNRSIKKKYMHKRSSHFLFLQAGLSKSAVNGQKHFITFMFGAVCFNLLESHLYLLNDFHSGAVVNEASWSKTMELCLFSLVYSSFLSQSKILIFTLTGL